MKKTKTKNIFMKQGKILLIAGAFLGFAFGSIGHANADSNPIKVADGEEFPQGTSQNLLISPSVPDSPVKVTAKSGEVTQKTLTDQGLVISNAEGGVGKTQMSNGERYAVGQTYKEFENKYGSTFVKFSTDSSKLKDIDLTVEYGQVGTDIKTGDPITATAEISDFTPTTRFSSTRATDVYIPGIEISNNLYSGFYTMSIESMNLKLNFTNQKTGKAIDFNNNGFITWNSLNPNVVNSANHGHGVEATAYMNSGDNKSYVTKDSVLTTFKNPLDSSLTMTGGVATPNQDYNSVYGQDSLGAAGFSNHSVTYLLSGGTQEFKIATFDPSKLNGSPALSKSNAQDFWFAPNSATVFTSEPEKPIKRVVDPKTKADMNGQTVKDNDDLQYQVSQKVNYLGVNALERYKSMEWTDVLPKQFVYSGAYLVDQNGNRITKDNIDKTGKDDSKSNSSASSSSSSSVATSSESSTNSSSSASSNTSSSTANSTSTSDGSEWAGTASFDKSTNTVTYKASNEFLAQMLLKGETYTLVIEGKVDSGGQASTFENTGVVNINSTSQKTNTVVNKTPTPSLNTLTKTVTDTNNKTGVSGSIEAEKNYSYTLTAKITDKKKLTSLKISDPLEKVQEYKKATVTQAGKDVTSQGTLSFDKATNTIDWQAKTPSDFSGKTLKMEILVQLKANADLSSYIGADGKISIPNVGNLTVDGIGTPSNPTTVTPPTVKPSAHKAVQLSGTVSTNDSDTGNVPDATSTGSYSDTDTSNASSENSSASSSSSSSVATSSESSSNSSSSENNSSSESSDNSSASESRSSSSETNSESSAN